MSSSDLRGHRFRRASLVYLAGYLLGGGVGLVVSPDFALRLLGGRANYGDALPRLTGGLMCALGAMISVIVWQQIQTLYAFAVFARVALLVLLGWLWARTADTLFASLGAIVGLGVVLTLAGYVLDRSSASTNDASRRRSVNVREQ